MQRTSGEHPATELQYTIFLKYGLIFEINVSPGLQDVTCFACGKEDAIIAPFLSGKIFSVE